MYVCVYILYLNTNKYGIFKIQTSVNNCEISLVSDNSLTS